MVGENDMRVSKDITEEVMSVEVSKLADRITSMKESMVAKILFDNLQDRYLNELKDNSNIALTKFAKNHDLVQINTIDNPDELIYSVDGKNILSIEDCSNFGGICGKCFIQYNVKSLDGKQIVYREESGDKNEDTQLLQVPVK